MLCGMRCWLAIQIQNPIFFQLSGIHHRLQKWVLMMILTWIWPISLMSLELAALDSEQPAPETAGSRDIKPIGQIQIRVRIIICTHFWSLWWMPESWKKFGFWIWIANNLSTLLFGQKLHLFSSILAFYYI